MIYRFYRPYRPRRRCSAEFGGLSDFQEKTDKVPDFKQKSKFGRNYGREKTAFARRNFNISP